MLSSLFQAPHPPDSWLGVRDATKPGSKCIQSNELFNFGHDTDTGQEDCLYLNVYVPSNVNTNTMMINDYVHTNIPNPFP